MKRILIFGNTGSGKTAIAKYISKRFLLKHLDLDDLAWGKENPPKRRELADSANDIWNFMRNYPVWVIEGSYTDLLRTTLNRATDVMFLNVPIEKCIENVRSRPWDPQKYSTQEEQENDLSLLEEMIASYDTRNDSFSLSSHLRIYESFQGKKQMITEGSKKSLPPQFFNQSAPAASTIVV